MKRTSNRITNAKDIDYILSIDQDMGAKTSTVIGMFGEFNGKRRFNTYDLVTIPAGSYGPEGKKNKNAFVTTVGLWVFNRVFIEKDLFDMFGYINKPITKKMVGNIMQEISYAILENRKTLKVMQDFVMKGQKFMPYVNILSTSYSMKLLTITTKINKAKEELIKKYRKELDAKDPKIVLKIQEELLDLAEEILKDDPAMDTYNSGAKSNMSNHFKNMFVVRGITKNPDPTKGYNIIMSNYMTGISKEDYADFANSLAEGPYSRASRTEVGGYWEKLLLPACQHIQTLEKGSDCGTKRTITITLNKDNIKEYIYCFMKEGNKLVELTSENMNQYIGKTVQFRFASLCESDKGICNACAGNIFYRLGVKNIGAAAPQIASKLKNVAMKAFHDSQVRMVEMDPMEAFGLK